MMVLYYWKIRGIECIVWNLVLRVITLNKIERFCKIKFIIFLLNEVTDNHAVSTNQTFD